LVWIWSHITLASFCGLVLAGEIGNLGILLWASSAQCGLVLAGEVGDLGIILRASSEQCGLVLAGELGDLGADLVTHHLGVAK